LRTFTFDGRQWFVVLIENPDRVTMLQERVTGDGSMGLNRSEVSVLNLLESFSNPEKA
jgi:hypothetical protein